MSKKSETNETLYIYIYICNVNSCYINVIYIYICITVYMHIYILQCTCFLGIHPDMTSIQNEEKPLANLSLWYSLYQYIHVYIYISHLQVDSRWLMVSTILQLSPNHAGKTQKRHVTNGLLTRMWGYPQECYLVRRSWICPKTTLPKFATLLENILLEKANILKYVKQSSNI